MELKLYELLSRGELMVKVIGLPAPYRRLKVRLWKTGGGQLDAQAGPFLRQLIRQKDRSWWFKQSELNFLLNSLMPSNKRPKQETNKWKNYILKLRY